MQCLEQNRQLASIDVRLFGRSQPTLATTRGLPVLHTMLLAS
jgi:hypothetical protein